jgi:hypothetical protein
MEFDAIIDVFIKAIALAGGRPARRRCGDNGRARSRRSWLWRSEFIQHRGNRFAKTGKRLVCDPPNVFIVYHRIAVDQHVAEIDDAAQVFDALGQMRRMFGQQIQRLADDLEFPFDAGANELVLLIAINVETGGELGDVVGGLPSVPQKHARITLHRSVLSTARSRRAKKDF